MAKNHTSIKKQQAIPAKMPGMRIDVYICGQARTFTAFQN